MNSAERREAIRAAEVYVDECVRQGVRPSHERLYAMCKPGEDDAEGQRVVAAAVEEMWAKRGGR